MCQNVYCDWSASEVIENSEIKIYVRACVLFFFDSDSDKFITLVNLVNVYWTLLIAITSG
jgi:hypothetical protein